jgi:hypothetical protein
VWIAGGRETNILKPIDKSSVGEITSHWAVTRVNVDVASKNEWLRGPSPQPKGEGSMGVPKSDRPGTTTSAGWKRQYGDKDTLSNWRSPPRPGEKSPEQGRSYDRLNREIDRRREGGGWVRKSGDAE